MSQLPHTSSLPDRAATVVPLRGSRAHAPNSVFVRARLGDGMAVAESRAGIAFFAAVCDRARAVHGTESRWWTQPVPVRVPDLAADALLPLADAEQAFVALQASGLLADVERGVLIDPDVLSECPALAWYSLDDACTCLRQEGQLAAPSIATLREIVRLADADGLLATTIPHLLEAVLYGRTRLTQALSTLERFGFVSRKDAPNRMVRLQLRSSQRSGISDPPPGSAPIARGSTSMGGRMRLPTNVPIEVGGVALDLIPGIVPELEVCPDGRAYLWLGPVRLGPYDP